MLVVVTQGTMVLYVSGVEPTAVALLLSGTSDVVLAIRSAVGTDDAFMFVAFSAALAANAETREWFKFVPLSTAMPEKSGRGKKAKVSLSEAEPATAGAKEPDPLDPRPGKSVAPGSSVVEPDEPDEVPETVFGDVAPDDRSFDVSG
mmetsp:Transcript_76435/g.212320  ORF Transcript_76435/g.212320 Transcript_76435/m.212320 type:complete len:147 (+) Transcript_76435:191-631(+)